MCISVDKMFNPLAGGGGWVSLYWDGFWHRIHHLTRTKQPTVGLVHLCVKQETTVLKEVFGQGLIENIKAPQH